MACDPSKEADAVAAMRAAVIEAAAASRAEGAAMAEVEAANEVWDAARKRSTEAQRSLTVAIRGFSMAVAP